MKFISKLKLFKLKHSKLSNESALKIAKLYYKEKEYLKAYEYFNALSKTNNKEVFLFLGELNFHDYIPKSSSYKAYEYYTKAYKLGEEGALFRIAYLKYLGKGTDRDVPNALKYFIMLAKTKRYPDALLNIGLIYLNGKNGVEFNFDYALKAYTVAYETYKLDCALNSIGMLYFKVKDYSNAKNYFIKAIKKSKDPLAYNNLGTLYFKGLGTSVDFVRAAECFKKSADLNNIQGKANYCLCLMKGLGVAEDFYLAHRLASECADKYHPVGLYVLGLFYETGIECSKSMSTAIRLFNGAAAQGLDLAIDHLKKLGLPVPELSDYRPYDLGF